MTRIEELEQQIRHHNDLYWNNKELEISDVEYDNLCRELEALDPENELLTEFGKKDIQNGEKLIKHSKPMLSLGKVYSIEELMKWVNKVARSSKEQFVIQPKYDGMSGLLENGTLSSRGDGINGQDYTDKLKIIQFDSPKKNINVKTDKLLGEIIISNSDFQTIYQNIKSKSGITFKNQRNGIAGILGTDDIDFYANQGARITFVDYDIAGIVKTADEIEHEFMTIAEDIRRTSNYPLDGIVIKLIDTAYSESLGYTTHHPKGQIAFKFTNQKKESVLRGIEWGMGKQQISAVGLIDPIEISGVTIKRVKLQLTKPKSTMVETCLIDGSLQIGDIIVVERAGDIIPHVISSTPGKDRTPVKIDKCPFCGGEIAICDSSIVCCNPDCKENLIQNLWNSVMTLGFKNIGEAFIRTLVEDPNIQVKNIADLLSLQKEDLILPEYGTKTKENFIVECEKAKKNAAKWQVIAALNIPNVGKTVSKILTENFEWDELVANTFDKEKLRSLNGIGETIVSSIRTYFIVKHNILKRLNFLFSFENEDIQSIPSNGKTICFTGKMEHKRSEMEDIAKSKGLIPMDHVDKNLNILVCADPDSSSSKMQKAKKLGIKIISEQDFMNGNF